MRLPTEPTGSSPGHHKLAEAVAAGDGADPASAPLGDEAVHDSAARFEATGLPVTTDGGQRKSQNFWTSCEQGMPNTGPHGFKNPFSAGQSRRSPRLTAGNSCTALAVGIDPVGIPEIIRRRVQPGRRAFVGLVDPIGPRVETPEGVRDRVLTAARYFPMGEFGACDDCGFAPFRDDATTTRETALEKYRERAAGTALASQVLGGG